MMNKQIETFDRETLKSSLEQCTEAQQHMFKRMYAKGKMDLDIDSVVDKMDSDKLDWAMQQVENTIVKSNNKTEE